MPVSSEEKRQVFTSEEERQVFTNEKERTKLIYKLKKEIKGLEHWYFDPEYQTKYEIVLFDMNNSDTPPKIMTWKEREETFNKKRRRIMQQLESLKWKHTLCIKCKKHKTRDEFKSYKNICQLCHRKFLKSKRKMLEKIA